LFSNGLDRLTFTGLLTVRCRSWLRQYWILVGIVAFSIFLAFTAQAKACAEWNGQTGAASYYGAGLQGRRTATGEAFDMWGMTAAHACLPMGTKIRVTVINTGRSLIVTVNDRMPSHRRILDLSTGAARALGIAGQGVVMVALSPR
jgi:rare lipoprotein A